MSLQDILGWQRRLQSKALPMAARIVGLAISLRVNCKTGSCFPSKACLSEDTGLSEETIRRGVVALVKAGLLHVQHSNGRLSNRYRLLCVDEREPNPLPSEEVNPLPSEEVNPLPSEEVLNSQPPRYRGSTPSLQRVNPLATEDRKEQKKEQKKDSSLLGSRPTVGAKVSIEAVEELMAHLNEKAGTRFEVRSGTGKLTSGAEAARQRIAEHGLERMKAVVSSKCEEWLGSEQAKYLRPATLFRKSNAENYAGQLGIKHPPAGTRPPTGGPPEPSGAAYRPFSFD